jgi:hypothetical protein
MGCVGIQRYFDVAQNLALGQLRKTKGLAVVVPTKRSGPLDRYVAFWRTSLT